MFSNIKKRIINLAKNAVLVAETEIGKGHGEKKKQLAIEYILKNLPFSPVIKEIISIFLHGFIDDAIESAVLYVKSLPGKE